LHDECHISRAIKKNAIDNRYRGIYNKTMEDEEKTTNKNQKFIDWLKPLIENKNTNRSVFAKEAGFDPATLTNIFNGSRSPGVDVCKLIAKYLGISELIVFYYAGILSDDIELNPTNEELNYVFNQLDHEGQERVLDAGRYEFERQQKRGNGRLS